jgi:hypothetical protein
MKTRLEKIEYSSLRVQLDHKGKASFVAGQYLDGTSMTDEELQALTMRAHEWMTMGLRPAVVERLTEAYESLM